MCCTFGIFFYFFIQKVITGDHLTVQRIPAVLITHLFLEDLFAWIDAGCLLKASLCIRSTVGEHISVGDITQIRICIFHRNSWIFPSEIERKIFVHICLDSRIVLIIHLHKICWLLCICKIQIKINISRRAVIIIKNSLHRFNAVNTDFTKSPASPCFNCSIPVYGNLIGTV